MPIVAIINPISGAGADPAVAAGRVALLRAEALRRGVPLEIHVTQRAGHARELAAAAAASGTRLVIAWGGDGTLNETGAALLHTRTALGVVPAGSGNGLAAVLGVPREARLAVEVAFGGDERIIDAGTMAGRPFFNIAGVGFDARVAGLFNARAAGSRGGWPYILIGVREGCRYRAQQYELELDGERRRLPALLVSFANGREYGMGARIAPAAELDDGLLDATVVEDRSVPARFWHARYLAYGTPQLAPRVLTRTVKHARINSAAGIEFHVDGETGSAAGPIDVDVVPGALTVKVERSAGGWHAGRRRDQRGEAGGRGRAEADGGGQPGAREHPRRHR